MVTTPNWVLMSYRVPREPSTPRISIWRRLRRLGVAKLGDGLVALPYDGSTKESLEWVANEVLEADGVATIWIATPASRRFGDDLAAHMASDRAAEYRELLESLKKIESSDARAIRAAQAQLRRIERRDYFPPPDRALARDAIATLTARLVSHQ